MTEIGGTATGTGGMHISSTIGSLFLTTASGSDWMLDSSRGITCRITPATTIRTITTLTFSRTITPRPHSAYPYGYYTGVQPDYNTATPNGAPVADPTVEATQERLAQLGYYNGPVDGIFGPTTRDAVAKYQIDNQLDVTGSLSPDTLQSLGVPPGPNN